MSWKVPKIWEGGECWIIGGGPSMTRQFEIPDEVINSVVESRAPLSAFSPYLSTLHDKHVIGVNVAYKLGPWVDIVFFGDSGFFLKNRFELANFKGVKSSCHHVVNGVLYQTDGIKYVPKDNNKSRGISEQPNKVCWNGNSGGAAINLAVLLGAKRIILLGFDMKVVEDKKHWHREYVPAGQKMNINNMHLPFHKHLIGFPIIAQDAKKRGVEILNASPQSVIDCFRKVTVKELL